MLAYDRTKKGIVFMEYLGMVKKHEIGWRQTISSKGVIYGIGSFKQENMTRRRRGNWSETLKKRMVRHKKEKEGGDKKRT